MATGDQNDQLGRLRALLPTNWFGNIEQPLLGTSFYVGGSPLGVVRSVINSILDGFSYVNAQVYAQITYAKLQTRIATATGGWLDLISSDFFGDKLPRNQMTDAQYLAQIKINMFRERATRKAVVSILTQLTGTAPIVFEPQRPADTGGYGMACGYGVAGGYGSLELPYQAFVTAYRPIQSGIPNVAGYGSSSGGYGQASQASYCDVSQVQYGITDQQIYSAINSVKPIGTILWTKILPNPNQGD